MVFLLFSLPLLRKHHSVSFTSLTEISLLVGQLDLANQMCFVSYSLSLNICALQLGENRKGKKLKSIPHI